MRFKDFEIRPICFLDGHPDPKRFNVVKWYKTDKPIKVTDGRTGKEKMQDTFCYSVAQIWWNDKEPCWEFESVGTRFLKDYEEGLCEFILKWLELTDLTRKVYGEGITMDVREKLVELLNEAFFNYQHGRGDGYIPINFADHLIANGVTVHEWIPVTDRLPQNYISVLVYLPGERPLPTIHEAYIGGDGEWHSSVVYGVENEDVTHWMPLPQPPKGETNNA